jgi:hypothetical protein
VKRAGVAESTGRGHWVEMSWNRKTTGNFVVDCPAPPWQCPHARAKTADPVSQGLLSGGSGSGREDPRVGGIREGTDAGIREEYALKGGRSSSNCAGGSCRTCA